jgi:tousled-like kinase
LSSSSLQQQPSSRTTPLSPTRSREAPDAKRGRHKAPLHNASIMQFFAPLGAKKTKAASKEFTNHENNNNSSSTTTALASPLTPPPRVSLTPTVRRPLQSPTPPLERLERRVRELEQQCHDKDEQLKAVSNNRTILHTALQSALVQRQKELVTLQTERKAWEGKSRAALETLVRDRATTEAKDVRERLAADGARLGRIVHSRAGMRVVETWEEGYASVQLQARRQALRERKILLQERYEKAAKIAKRMDEVEDGNANDGEEADMAVGGVHVRTALDASEAKESARFHLQTLLLDEKKLATEESSLKEEQGAHVRALKRVASEDASRFKARPKLHDRYLLKHLLGKGGFSEVWRAYDLMELREVAVKIHQLDPRWSDSKKENFTKHVSREYEIHRNVRHPRIVSLFDVFEIDNNSFATVLECCDGSDLDTLLKTRRSLTERDARAILLQIISGMRYLNQPSEDGSHQGIIHYDLKPGNILFDEFGDAKITDFGLSKIVDAVDSNGGMELTSQGAGTYWYLPPECFMLDDNVRISNKVDVWSIGVIFYQMLFGRRPFGDGQSQDAILADGTVLNAHQVSFPEKVSVSEECKDFLRTCLTYDQSFRPTVSQLCSQSYVLSKDFSSK